MDFQYYRLATNPFSQFSPDRLYWSRGHQTLWDYLVQTIDQREGIIVITGPTGLGKTTLLDSYQSHVDPKHVRILTGIDAALTQAELLTQIAQACRLDRFPKDPDSLSHYLNTFFAEEYAQGRNAVLLIDDAHTLPTTALQNVHRLSERMTSSAGHLLQVILCGRPALEQRCNLPELQQFKASVGTFFSLPPLTHDESVAYIQQHLNTASSEAESIFTKGATKLIVDQAHGIPKVINIICTDVLVAGMLRGEKPISAKTVREALGEVPEEPSNPMVRWGLAGAAAFLLVVGLWSLLPRTKPVDPVASQAQSTGQPRAEQPVASSSTATPAQTEMAVPSPSVGSSQQQTSTSNRQAARAEAAPQPALAALPPNSLEPATAAPQAALATTASQPLALPLRDGTVPDSLSPDVSTPSPASGGDILQQQLAETETPNIDSADSPKLPPSRVVCVLPRTRGNRGSDIVLIDHQAEGIHRLVSDGLQNMSPALSPDGALLAYTSYRDGAPNIFLRDLATGQEKPLTSGPWLALPGAWSPDGRYLALSQSLEGNNDIFLYDVKDKRLRRLTTHRGIDVSPSFAPDGKRLVFASDRTGSPQLYLTDITGKPPVRLTQSGPYNTSPAWSPNGETIAFIGRSNGQALDLYLIQSEGTQLRRLTEQQRFHAPPTWSPDGQVLMGMSLKGSSWERHLVHISGKPNAHRLPQNGPLCLAPQWVAQRVP